VEAGATTRDASEVLVDRSSGAWVDRYYDPTTGLFLTVDPLVDETGEPYAYTGDDPVNALDPLGLSGDGDPFFACQNSSGRQHLDVCAAEEYEQLQKIDSVEQKLGSLYAETCTARSGSGISNSFTGNLPSVFIPGPVSVTIQSSFSISGPDGTVNVAVEQDGSVVVSSVGSSAAISPTGALSGAEGSHGVSVSSDGSISYMSTSTASFGADYVTLTTTATIRAEGPPPAGSLFPAAEAAGAGAGVAIIGVVVSKAACAVLGPDPAAAVCALAVP